MIYFIYLQELSWLVIAYAVSLLPLSWQKNSFTWWRVWYNHSLSTSSVAFSKRGLYLNHAVTQSAQPRIHRIIIIGIRDQIKPPVLASKGIPAESNGTVPGILCLSPPCVIDNVSGIAETIQNSPSTHKTLKHYFNQVHLRYHNKLNAVDH